MHSSAYTNYVRFIFVFRRSSRIFHLILFFTRGHIGALSLGGVSLINYNNNATVADKLLWPRVLNLPNYKSCERSRFFFFNRNNILRCSPLLPSSQLLHDELFYTTCIILAYVYQLSNNLVEPEIRSLIAHENYKIHRGNNLRLIERPL